MQERVFQPNLRCSQLMAEIIAALRGERDEDAFLSDLLSDAVKHKLEEAFQRDREIAYHYVVHTDNFKKIRELMQIRPAEQRPEPNTVAGFPRDVTRHKSLS